ncbi:MAG: hypothetical protein IRZ02_01270 [Acidothermus sp.]|nr:hypothetical protein [Acidothermus sp.]MCL6538136.1 hypothetical protein [Acidothermus sp.]
MSEEARAVLTCANCAEPTLHVVRYAGRLIADIRCTRCGTITARDSREAWAEYLRDLEQRLLSKPTRTARRAVRDPVGFVVRLPLALARQPMKLLREWKVLREISRH